MFHILTIFAAILILNRCGVSLGLALALGGAALDLWAGHRGVEFVHDLHTAVTRPEMWLLMVIVALVMELGRFLAEQQNASVILAVARRLGGRHGRAISLMAIPAAIGLLPMPGGALFSAPLVGQTVEEECWTGAWKAAVNYWFRHVWEYWVPIFPVVILAMSIFEMPTWQYMATMIPFSFLSLASGYLFLVRPHIAELAMVQYHEPVPWRRALFLWLPFKMVVLAALVLPHQVHRMAPGLSSSSAKMIAMLIGLTIGLAIIFWDEWGRFEHKPFAGLMKRSSLNMLVTLAGVMIFQSFLDSSGLLPEASADLVAGGIPIIMIVTLLPFVAGFVTGIAIGYVGPAFPLVIGLMEAEGSGLTPMATLALAFGFGYAGMMLSPVHLCFVLTKDYFVSPYRLVYRHLRGCVAALMVGSVLIYAFLSYFGW